jgi:hypothetical protein
LGSRPLTGIQEVPADQYWYKVHRYTWIYYVCDNWIMTGGPIWATLSWFTHSLPRVTHIYCWPTDPLGIGAQWGQAVVVMWWDLHCNILVFQVNSILNEKSENKCMVHLWKSVWTYRQCKY